MPLYDYKCSKCGEKYEVFSSMKDVQPSEPCGIDGCDGVGYKMFSKFNIGKTEREIGYDEPNLKPEIDIAPSIAIGPFDTDDESIGDLKVVPCLAVYEKKRGSPRPDFNNMEYPSEN